MGQGDRTMIIIKSNQYKLYGETLIVDPAKVYTYDGYVSGLRLYITDEDSSNDIPLTSPQVQELVTYLQDWLTARDQT